MCKVLKVDRTSYYSWVKGGSIIEKSDKALNMLIEDIFHQSRQTYGTRRIKALLLQNEGLILSRR